MSKLYLYNYYLDDDYGEIALVGKNPQEADEYEVMLDEAEDFRPYIVLSYDPYTDYADKVYLDELPDRRKDKQPIFSY